MKASVIRVVIGMIIFSIGYFVWDPTVGLSMQLACYVGMYY